MKIGLAQYAGAMNYRHFLGPYQKSPYLIVFGAFIYCLKQGNREAAELLIEISKRLKGRDAL